MDLLTVRRDAKILSNPYVESFIIVRKMRFDRFVEPSVDIFRRQPRKRSDKSRPPYFGDLRVGEVFTLRRRQGDDSMRLDELFPAHQHREADSHALASESTLKVTALWRLRRYAEASAAATSDRVAAAEASQQRA